MAGAEARHGATHSPALARDRTIDITTTGRRGGQPRRAEDLVPQPGRADLHHRPRWGRDWYANLLGDPRFTFHLKESAAADLPARAIPVTDQEERRAILARILDRLERPDDLDAWIAGSPLVEVSFADD